MSLVRCPLCNVENLPQARYCDNCGTFLTMAPKTMHEGNSWIIGSASDCDLRVEAPTVSGHHCRLTETDKGFILEDLGSTNGAFVNGQRVESRVRVSRSDVITLGRSVPLPWPPKMTVVESKEIRIGRDPDNDVVLDYPVISGHHARIVFSGDAAIIEDIGSTNGIAIGSPDRKVAKSKLSMDDTVYFGSFPVPAARLLRGRLTLGPQPHTTLSFHGQSMVLGRDPNCDHVLDHPMVSRRHARLTRSGDGLRVEDLGSTNGTFVNGQRITRPVTVEVGDIIGLGSYTFQLTPVGTIEERDYRGNVTIEGKDVTVDVQGKRLIDNVSLTIYPSELVGLMGPSGAGKTTLMNALNGYTLPTGGTVLFNGLDLYANYGQFSKQLGYVPQDDIMHPELTVKQALYYTARLRLPSDSSKSDIEARIQDVLCQLGLQGTEDVPIGSPEKKGISGGQRKRVNLAMELLSDPWVLFLDEPTSGLASDDALMVMELLRKLADAGKTILLTIHQPSLEVFRIMDSLIVISKDRNAPEPARMVYFGPAYPDSLHFFNPGGLPTLKPGADPSPDEVLRGLSKCKTEEWVEQYAASTYKRRYVDDRSGKQPFPSEETGEPKIERNLGFSQWATLVRRCLTIKSKDIWVMLGVTLAIPILLFLGFAQSIHVKATPQNWLDLSKDTGVLIFTLIISALFLGLFNSVRAIVGEWAVYRRERMVNLKIPSYVFSKFSVLGGLCLVQCLILLGIVHIGCGLQAPWLPMLSILTATSIVGVAGGLIISAGVQTSEKAMTWLFLVLIIHIVLGGTFLPMHKMKKDSKILWTLSHGMASRWAFEGLLLLENQHRRPPLAPAVSQSQTATAVPGPSQTGSPGTARPGAVRDRAMGIHSQGSASMPELAEPYFPKDERFRVRTCVMWLLGVLAGLIAGIHAILKARDIH